MVPNNLSRVLRWLLCTLLLIGTFSLGVAPQPTAANEGDYCFISATLKPGKLDASGICQPDSTFPVGGSCGDDLYFNGSQCVANNTTCTTSTTSGGEAGVYQSGICKALPTPTPPTAPQTPSGFTPDSNGGALPSGEQQPMCVNASPFIGGGAFVVSGTQQAVKRQIAGMKDEGRG